MKKTTLVVILFAALAVYGCGDDSNDSGGSGGDAGSGGTAGTGAMGGGGSGGTAGTGAMGGGGSGGGLPPGTIYDQDFNSLDINGDVIGDGWIFFNNVFDGTTNPPTFKFGYPQPPVSNEAPNGTGNISGLVDNQGGDDQGAQQFSVFSDYTCCDLGGNPEQGHGNGTDLVEVNVFRERTIVADDVGKILTFSFDAKAGDLAGATTAAGFIKTLDPNMGFALTNFETVNTTGIPDTWMRYEVSLSIDAGLVNQVLQYGFTNTASNFDDSNNFYDNVLVVLPDP